MADCVDRLLEGFKIYDRAVDVVSAFEMVFTTSQTDVPGTVERFERFPRVPGSGGTRVKPDFSVLFCDGTGMVGEIARFALRDSSVDDLCSQIERYDSLRNLPGADSLVDVAHTDVLLLVPMALGTDAVQRVIADRYEDSAHPYQPSVPPCIVQFAFDDDRYVFQRLPDPRNGFLRDGDRADGLGRWFDENGHCKIRPGRFRDIKADRAFMNDPADELYLATHLWSKTFANWAGDGRQPLRLKVQPAQLAEHLRAQHGGVRRGDVERALELLTTAKLAEPDGTGSWVVAWEQLRVVGEKELAHAIATRACRPKGRGPVARLEATERAARTEAQPRPPTLF